MAGMNATPFHLCPTVSRSGSLYQALLPWYWCSGTAYQEVKFGATAGIGANFVMLVEVNLPRIHHLSVHREVERRNQVGLSLILATYLYTEEYNKTVKLILKTSKVCEPEAKLLYF